MKKQSIVISLLFIFFSLNGQNQLNGYDKIITTIEGIDYSPDTIVTIIPYNSNDVSQESMPFNVFPPLAVDTLCDSEDSLIIRYEWENTKTSYFKEFRTKSKLERISLGYSDIQDTSSYMSFDLNEKGNPVKAFKVNLDTARFLFSGDFSLENIQDIFSNIQKDSE
ncbi:MAG: hypothetical protein AAF573_13120, partial [Bacteroidota bacterium]